MNKIISIVVIIILIIAGWMLLRDRAPMPEENTETNTEVPEGTTTETNTSTGTPTSTPTSGGASVNVGVGASVGQVKEFTVDASSFKFIPGAMTVNRGDTVKITVKNSQGVHDLKIDEFNAGTRVLQAGESETITFVADKAGTFEYYCSVGNHRAMGMVGTLRVN